ncbi:exopolysaccharide biosynthesis protein [Sphingomonas ginkgonis]|uniref:Exopolysaccharide biosynthesis protein n=1 Tax=Sphingomonas ginkgonis TaxID=2315330 RepID=A0A3R9X7E9_9SPHN|nr:exopolysaccharide biosynthesis protein [Sphingomonas ginkgonis]RST30550.1 exopolysaccharide biosynthesis protein [Sphingomonas ginkgonis]
MSNEDLTGETAELALSEQLAAIVASEGPDRLTFTDLARRLDARAWGGLLLVFAAINMLPLPPGTSAFFALPLMIVSAQMVVGRAAPWFPGWLNRRGVSKHEIGRLVEKMGWLERKVERLFRPRLLRLSGHSATRLVGLVCFLLALVAAIPVPLFHIAPAAAIALFGLALIYRDGMLIIAAGVAAVLSIVVDAVIAESGFVALSYALSWLHF